MASRGNYADTQPLALHQLGECDQKGLSSSASSMVGSLKRQLTFSVFKTNGRTLLGRASVILLIMSGWRSC